MIRTLIVYKYPLIYTYVRNDSNIFVYSIYFLLEHSRKKNSKPIKTLMREYRTF